MAIRRREKPLSQQETIDLVKREYLACWTGSEPLIAGVEEGGKVAAYPLDPRLSERLWILAFLDPVAMASQEILHFTGEWARRYEAQKLGAIAVLEPKHAFVRDPQWILRWGLRHQVNFPIFLDRENLLARAFQVGERPWIVLLAQGQAIFHRSGPGWFDALETLLQEHLRKTDPGLPLFAPFVREGERSGDLLSVDLGRLEIPSSGSLAYPGLPDPIRLSGQWKKEKDGGWTPTESRSTISFRCPGRKLGIVAHAPALGSAATTAAATIPVELQVELEREFGKGLVAGPDLTPVALGSSKFLRDPRDRLRGTAAVQDARLYRLFELLPPTHRQVILRFPGARNPGISIYSLRFAD